ncbi:MAG: hypothetical protein ACRDM0_16225 [Thermoleophilaceae bacterium]
MAKRLSIVLGTTVAAVVLATPAQAGLLTGLLPGLVSPADSPSTCDTNVSQPFTPWGDRANYVLTPGGSFESGGPSWNLSGGARIVRGNEPFYVRSTSDRHSLYMPSGSSVVTPPMCFAAGDWKMRFFATGSGKVRVQVRVKSLLGLLSILDGGTMRSGGTWRPSPEIGLLVTNLGGILATDSVSFRLIARDGSVRVDDVYLDPWKST